MKLIISIYCLEKNGIPFYIGKTKNVEQRMAFHKRNHGDITYIILHEFNYFASLFSNEGSFWEHHYIWLFKSLGFELINKQVKKTSLSQIQKYELTHSLPIRFYDYNRSYDSDELELNKKYFADFL